jgi:hypothetical protein
MFLVPRRSSWHSSAAQAQPPHTHPSNNACAVCNTNQHAQFAKTAGPKRNFSAHPIQVPQRMAGQTVTSINIRVSVSFHPDPAKVHFGLEITVNERKGLLGRFAPQVP